MPVDLSLTVGKKVFIQVKSLTYIIGKLQGQLMPAMTQDEKGNTIPLTVDYVLGTVDKVEADGVTHFVVRYTLPDGAKMQALLDPDFVQCVFFEDDTRIEITSAMPDPPDVQ